MEKTGDKKNLLKVIQEVSNIKQNYDIPEVKIDEIEDKFYGKKIIIRTS